MARVRIVIAGCGESKLRVDECEWLYANERGHGLYFGDIDFLKYRT